MNAFDCISRVGNRSDVQGVNGPVWDVITGKAARDDAEVNAKIAQLNQDRANLGIVTQEQADADTARLMEMPDDFRSQVWDELEVGIKEGAAKEISFVQDTVQKVAEATGTLLNETGKTAAKAIWAAIPWWVWIGGAVYGAWYFGLIGRETFASARIAGRRAGRAINRRIAGH